MNTPPAPDDLFARLKAMDVSYTVYHHRPVFTVAESTQTTAHIPGLHCRNLFLRDKKGVQFLLTVGNETSVDLKALAAVLPAQRLSFGSAERLWDALATTPGSVSPFAIMYDADHTVTSLLDSTMMTQDLIAVHPLVNTMTITLAPSDLMRFIGVCHSTPRILTFPL